MDSVSRALCLMLAGQAFLASAALVRSMPQMSQEEAREMKVQNMLKDVQDMARSGANPNSEKIRTIKEIVDAQLIPDLEATHELEKKQVAENLKSIDTCNTNSAASQKTIADGVGKIVRG